MVFFLFGVSWVLPYSVMEKSSCWTGHFGQGSNGGICEVVPFVSNVVSLERKECMLL